MGPRDGLQNEKTLVPTDVKVEFIRLARDTTEGLFRYLKKDVVVSVDWQQQG